MWSRKQKVFVLFNVTAVITIILLFYRENYIYKQLEQIHEQTCKRPDLPVDAAEMMKFVKFVKPIDCSKAPPNWVICENSQCKILDEIQQKFGPVLCNFTDLIRVDDMRLKDGSTTSTKATYDLKSSDVVRVNCIGQQDAQWSSVLTAIRRDETVLKDADWSKLSNDSFHMNVLMFGFDSISRNTFIRKLPKSYNYMVDVLKTHVLNGYNIVGDGTPQALIPILTGQTELELPNTKKRMKDSQFVNVYPFVWNDFKKAGYVTGYFEDVPDVGIFTYRLKGFKEQPTDHYMRPYYVAAKSYLKKWRKLCSGSTPRHKVMFDQMKNFYKVYEALPKFLFAFHGELSHDDYNLVGAADEDLQQFLQNLYESNILNNTVLIIMADHGHRFAEIRNTIQGKFEERLPFFSFTFPPTFKIGYPKAYKNFLSNIDKLVTPFDIHATFKSMLEYVDDNTETKRSMSLFNKIPSNRSCEEAFIEPHWCTCLDWIDIPLEHPVVEKLQMILEATLNEFTKNYRSMCAELSVSRIYYVTKLLPKDGVVKYAKNADYDGFVPDLSAKTKVDKNIYQIKALLNPGNSIFEASITHYLDEDSFKLEMKDISRINMYGTQARCVENDLPDLRKYCYCVD